MARVASKGFWLSVGTLEPRKNYVRLLHAYARHVAEVGPTAALPLVIAGARGWLLDDINRHVDQEQLRGRVVFLGYVDDAELHWLYKHCFAFVFVSNFEGFGLPVVEAMSLGAAVIASNTTSLPEIVGDAGLLVDPVDVPAISAALSSLVCDDARREVLKQRSVERAPEFFWSRAAYQVHEITRL